METYSNLDHLEPILLCKQTLSKFLCQHSKHNIQYFLGDCHIWKCKKVQLAKGKLQAELRVEGRERRKKRK